MFTYDFRLATSKVLMDEVSVKEAPLKRMSMRCPLDELPGWWRFALEE
ncbi:hypothetical protein HS1genome_1688 [Sulfodiicoccus acidiphilus]|uniref:Uncharacterized protein n=1 Tax=Sulfodiicoccus acidiphilus TaxID=1670455 RepID=A0A348B547_9CREN|nr:hypothetical protein [Sulfodiicoccus acidiphilus]BBD73299.1 hypothetical protein HS1genome_1688 [Sulfodiicoccus acidiphilus]GGT89281.1 hypothetical protein GCM10007116_03910 [Sulfodiicoccus acidiphilus]